MSTVHWLNMNMKHFAKIKSSSSILIMTNNYNPYLKFEKQFWSFIQILQYKFYSNSLFYIYSIYYAAFNLFKHPIFLHSILNEGLASHVSENWWGNLEKMITSFSCLIKPSGTTSVNNTTGEVEYFAQSFIYKNILWASCLNAKFYEQKHTI